MRIRVTTEEVAHLWAHASQDEANNGSNHSFRDGSLYSYRTEIASRIQMNKGGGVLFLIGEATYSSTTGKHQNYASSAVVGNGEIIHVIGAELGGRIGDCAPNFIAAKLSAYNLNLRSAAMRQKAELTKGEVPY